MAQQHQVLRRELRHEAEPRQRGVDVEATNRGRVHLPRLIERAGRGPPRAVERLHQLIVALLGQLERVVAVRVRRLAQCTRHAHARRSARRARFPRLKGIWRHHRRVVPARRSL